VIAEACENTEMLLADCSSDNHCFEFDPHTGAYSHLRLPTPRKARAGYSGMGQLLRSPREGKVLVAKYLRDGDAWFSIGAEKWKLFDSSLTLTHCEAWGVFLCELVVYRGGQCIRKLRYLRRDWFSAMIDPAYDDLDFSLANLPVVFVPHDLSSVEKQRADFIEMWSSDSRSAGPLHPE
jgi:hypothetical protein